MSLANLTTVILAAGNSSRMGTSKQLLILDGMTLLERTVKCALEAGLTNIIVVLGSDAVVHQATINHLPVSIAENMDWRLGMGNSLKFGLKKAIELWPNSQAILTLVCDQPKLSVNHLHTVVRAWESTQSPIVASTYAGVNGIPALFSKDLFHQLANIDNVNGARSILRNPDAELVRIPFVGGEIDLDTLNDYQTYLAKG